MSGRLRNFSRRGENFPVPPKAIRTTEMPLIIMPLLGFVPHLARVAPRAAIGERRRGEKNDNMNSQLTSMSPVFIDSALIFHDFSGLILVNLPDISPNFALNEIARINCVHLQEVENKGMTLVFISTERRACSIKGRISTTTLMDGEKCYLTSEGVGLLCRPERKKPFAWMFKSNISSQV